MKHVYFSLTYRSKSYIFAAASCYNSSHYTSACITTRPAVGLITPDLNEGWENLRQRGLASKAFISAEQYLKMLSELACAGRGSEGAGNAVRKEWVFPSDEDLCCAAVTGCNRSGEQGTMRTDVLLQSLPHYSHMKNLQKDPRKHMFSAGRLISLPRK